MILIDTYVKPYSVKNAGDGLYTKEFIQKGRPIWKRSDRDITLTQEEAFGIYWPLESEYLVTYGTQEPDGNWHLDTDNMRFINHGYETENIRFYPNIGIALKDIQIGEELFTNYMDITSVWHFKKLLNIK